MKLQVKNLQRLLYRSVADDVLLQKHFTGWDYLDWFWIYERFYEPRYFVNMSSSSRAAAIAELP